MVFERVLFAGLALAGTAGACAFGQESRPIATDPPYAGWTVVHAAPTTDAQLRAIEQIGDIWNDRYGVGPMDVALPPDGLAALESMGIDYKVTVPDLQGLIDEVADQNELARLRRDDSWYVAYRRYDEMVARLKAAISK